MRSSDEDIFWGRGRGKTHMAIARGPCGRTAYFQRSATDIRSSIDGKGPSNLHWHMGVAQDLRQYKLTLLLNI